MAAKREEKLKLVADIQAHDSCLICFKAVIVMYPSCHKPVEKGSKVNCGTCKRLDKYKGVCKDKALRYAEWDKKHRWAERMMEQNRGVRLE
jgi:uncharacterized Fe-S center protein